MAARWDCVLDARAIHLAAPSERPRFTRTTKNRSNVDKVDLQIDIEFEGELLLVTASGSVRLDSALRLFRQVFDTAAERHVSKIVVNTLAVEGELAGHERYKLGAELATYISERRLDLKLAFVGVPPR